MSGGEYELWTKLGLKTNAQAHILHAPIGYCDSSAWPIPILTIDEMRNGSDWIQAFYSDKATLEKEIDVLKQSLAKKGQLWICWPKKSSGVKSDLSDGAVRRVGLNSGLVDVKVASINETWSGLKFVFRLQERVS